MEGEKEELKKQYDEHVSNQKFLDMYNDTETDTEDK